MHVWDTFAADHPVHRSDAAKTCADAVQELLTLETLGGACHGISFVHQDAFCINNPELMEETGDGKFVYTDWPLPVDADVIHNIQVQGADRVTFVCGAGYKESEQVHQLTFIRLAAQQAFGALRLYWRQKPPPDRQVHVNMCKTLYCEGHREFIAQHSWKTIDHQYADGVIELITC